MVFLVFEGEVGRGPKARMDFSSLKQKEKFEIGSSSGFLSL